MRVFEVSQHVSQRIAALRQSLGGLAKQFLRVGTFSADLAQLLGDLSFGHVTLGGQIEQAVLGFLQLGQATQRAGALRLVVRLVQQGIVIEQVEKLLPGSFVKTYRVVVRFHCLLDVPGAQIRQVTLTVLAAAADVVEVQLAGLALAAHHD